MLVWFGVFGAPFAWVVQFLTGFGIAIAACAPPGSSRPVAIDGLALAATIAAAAVAVLAGASAFAVLRQTREASDDDAPPPGRLHFLAVVGLTVTPLFFFIIVLSGLGVVTLENCRQG